MGYTHGRKWSHKDICDEVYKVMKSLNIDRMPSAPECKLVTGSSALNSVIVKRGGFKWLANNMGLKQSDCETRLGSNGELTIKKILESLGYRVEKMSIKHPYDLLVNENIKIDVKTARKYNSDKGWSSYSFNLEKSNPTCDIYVFICVEDEKYLIIPSKFLRQTQLCITDKESKYDVFKDKWEYVEVYNKFYKWLE